MLNDFLVLLSVLIIRLYKKILAPILHKRIRCRFYPDCSSYGILALKKYGFVKGWKKSFNRIKRCRVDNFNSCIDFL